MKRLKESSFVSCNYTPKFALKRDLQLISFKNFEYSCIEESQVSLAIIRTADEPDSANT
jgi:hypothetical protein